MIPIPAFMSGKLFKWGIILFLLLVVGIVAKVAVDRYNHAIQENVRLTQQVSAYKDNVADLQSKHESEIASERAKVIAAETAAARAQKNYEILVGGIKEIQQFRPKPGQPAEEVPPVYRHTLSIIRQIEGGANGEN